MFLHNKKEIELERKNSLLLVSFLFLSSLTLPINLIIGNGIVVWIITFYILAKSLCINNFKINKKILCIVICTILLFILNMLIVDYRDLVINIFLEFIKFGLIPLYLASNIKEYKYLAKYWYILGIVNLIIWYLCLPKTIAGQIDYMQMGVYMTYSLIIFCIRFYNEKSKQFINFMLIILTIIPIAFFANRISLVICIAFIIYNEVRLIKYRNIIYSYTKIVITVFISSMCILNLNSILIRLSDFLKTMNISSYSINKLIMMVNSGFLAASSGRDSIYVSSIEIIKKAYGIPRGMGYFTHITGEIYPHNIILDMLICFGIIGIFLLLLLVIIFYKKYKIIQDNDLKQILIYLMIFLVIRLNFSGSFYNEVPLWITIGLLVGYKNESLRSNVIDK